ncbi:hypothetical protein ACWEQ8_22820 [Streptomyces noursei]
MLFSISGSGWWLIAVAATAFFLIGLFVLCAGMKLPEDLRDAVEQPSKRAKRTAALLPPVGCAAILLVNLLRPEPAPAILFLYSVACTAFPIALLPVRGRMLRHYVEQKRMNPDAADGMPDGLTVAWVTLVLCGMVLAAVVALMIATYHGRQL